MQTKAWIGERTETESLTPAEHRQLGRVVERIDVTQGSATLDYGLAAQIRFSGLADDVAARLDATRGPRENLTRLLAKVCELDSNGTRQRGLGIDLPMLSGWADTEDGWLGRYESARTRIDRLVPDLHSAAGWIVREVALLDRLAARARAYLKELDLLVLAGEAKVDELRGTALPRLAREADDAVEEEAFERLRRFSERVEQFERRVEHLKTARSIGQRTVPQIRAVQRDLEALLEQVQSVLSTTIPLWKRGVIDAVTAHRAAGSADLGQALKRTLQGVRELVAGTSLGDAPARDAGPGRPRLVAAATGGAESGEHDERSAWRRMLHAPGRALREAFGGAARFGG